MNLKRNVVSLVGIVLAVGFPLLTGCGVQSSDLAGSDVHAASIRVSVHGGQQPVVGSQVYLYATTTNGYGATATSLLNAPGYVTTNGNGIFTLTGDYATTSCPSASSQAYVVALGGNAGAGTNNAIALMAPLGLCSALNSSISVQVNEVTTVASVFALHEFFDSTARNIGTSSTNTAGLANAFATISNLVSVSGGSAYATTPTTAANGTVPQSTINTLANLLATCINNSSVCSTIFSSSTSGTAPTDTLGLALALAKNPTYNVANTFSLISSTPPFGPALSTAPNDWGLEVIYAGTGTASIATARYLDIDSSSNIYIANANNPTKLGFVSEFSNVGAPIAMASGSTSMQGIAITPTGNIYAGSNAFSGTSPNVIGAIYSFGTTLQSPFPIPVSTCQPWQIAIDATGYILMGNSSSQYNPYICSYNPSTQTSTSFSAGYPSANYAIAVGPGGKVWADEGGNGYYGLIEASDSNGALSAGTTASTSSFPLTASAQFYSVAAGNGYAWTVGGNQTGVYYAVKLQSVTGTQMSNIQVNLASSTTSGPTSYDAQVDGDGNLWYSLTNGTLSTIPSGSTTVNTLQNSAVTALWGIGIDSSGNVWASSQSSPGQLVEYIGVAAPLQTPRAAAVASNTIATRP